MNHQQQKLQQQINSIQRGDHKRTLLTELRDMIPGHLGSEKQASALAERLALRMRQRLDLDEDYPFPSSAIDRLPRIEVLTKLDLTDPNGNTQSGLSGWDPKRRIWVIAINGSEYPLRQRFSLMHEYAHVVLGQATRTPSQLERFLPGVGTYTSSERLENLCDRFAANLLMPRPLMKRAWSAGHQDVRTLSRLFGVSKMAMRHRLHDLGFVEPVRRHRPYFGNTLYFRAVLPSVEPRPARLRDLLGEGAHERNAA